MSRTPGTRRIRKPAPRGPATGRRRSGWEQDPATIRALFLEPFVAELEGGVADVDGFLRRYGFSSLRPDRPYEQVPLRQFVALAEAMANRLDRPFLGLELGQRFKLADFGLFYPLFTLVDNVRSALDRFIQFQSAWQTHTSMDVVRGEQLSIYRYCIQDPTIWPRRQDAEFALASICSLIRDLTQARWQPVEVEFEHEVGEREARLRQFFRCPVSGGHPANLIVIANDDLRRPVRRRPGPRDGDLLPMLERHLLDLLGAPRQDRRSLIEHTSWLVARRLGRASVEIDAVAAEMNLSARTLRRRLALEGTSFRAILQEQRRIKLETLLRDGVAPLAQLAESLGYSDPAVLSRAFRAWTGTCIRRFTDRNAEPAD